MKLYGGSITANELMIFLKESYEDPAKPEILGYVLDEKISMKSMMKRQMTARVYVNEALKKVMVVHRGTGMEMYGSDWLNNIVYGTAGIMAYKLTPRYQRAKAVQDAVHKKYKSDKWEVNTIGHSQAGLITHLLGSQSKNAIQFNPASKSESLGKNEYIVRSEADAVSALSVPQKMLNQTLYPNWSDKHYITIKAQSNDPIKEHSPDILARLPPDKKIGKGMPKFPLESIGFVMNLPMEVYKLKGYVINQVIKGGNCGCKSCDKY